MKTIIKVNGIPFVEVNGTINIKLGDSVKILGNEYVVVSKTVGPGEIEADCMSNDKFERLCNE